MVMPKGVPVDTPKMRAVKEKLRKCGLPETLFEADFEQQMQAAAARHDELRQVFAQLEASPEWKDEQLPWTRQADLPLDAQPNWLLLVQGRKTSWTKGLKDVNAYLRTGGIPLFLDKKLMENHTNGILSPRRRARLIAQGYDPDNRRPGWRKGQGKKPR